ncbi:MAG: alpha/beta hydrolase [Geminicoccaceae bacterium]|nr:alpha/beta hydrolase [Geminicoccaceae bacterium]
MLFLTNRRLFQGPRSQAGRRIEFDLADNEPQASIFFARRQEPGAYEELTSTPFLEELRRSDAAQVLLYLHGYNCLPEDAFVQTEELQHGFDVLAPGLLRVVPMIWPCDDDFGLLRDYWDDQVAAEQSGLSAARALAKFVAWRDARPRDVPCLKHMNVLAHSMGNRVMRCALERWADAHGALQGLFRFIFMAAADVADETLEVGRPGAVIAAAARHLVVYHAADDFALRTSKVVNVRNRALTRRLGHHGPEDPAKVPRNVTSVDCNAFNGLYDRTGHNYHGLAPDGSPGLVLRHMAEAMQQGRVPGRTIELRALALGVLQEALA